MKMNSIINLFIPNRCEICGRIIGFLKHCPECIKVEEKIDLGINYPLDIKNRKLHYVDKMFACYKNKYGAKKGIYRLKFQKQYGLIKLYAKQMAKIIVELNEDFDYIIPIPMTKRKNKKRGINVPLELSKEISKLTKIPIKTDVIIKKYETKAQHEIKLKFRKNNLLGSMQILNKNDIMGKSVLLIDDLITTGQTIESCSRLLKVYYVKKITAISFTAVEFKSNKEIQNEQ